MLIGYSNSSGGGMTGGWSYVNISYKDGRCFYYSSEKVFYDDPCRTTSYYADHLLEKIDDVLTKYDIVNRGEPEILDIVVYDALTTNIKFTFDDGGEFNIGNNAKYTNELRDAFNEITKLINESVDYAEDLKEEILKEDFAMFNINLNAMSMYNKENMATTNNSEDILNIKFCRECGSEFTGSEKFCSNCGAVRK